MATRTGFWGEAAMQFMTSLLGESAGAVVTSVLALGIVLVLVVLGLWLVQLPSRSAHAGGGGPQRRLHVLHNVEHLILTGGPADLVIESGIPVERPPAAAHRPPQHEVPPPQNPSLTRNEIDRLRQFVRGGAPRQGPSLRHTGLLRPVSTMEPAIIPMPPMAGDNSGRPGTDSATTPQGAENGRTAFGAQRNLGATGTADTR